MGALENAHEHRVHHPKNTDKYGQKRRAPTHSLYDAKSLTVAQMFAYSHGPDFRDLLLDLTDDFLNLLLGSRRRHSNIYCVDLIGRADDCLQERQ